LKESSFNVAEMSGELLEWEWIHDTIRPHQAPGYLTSLQFLEQWEENQRKEVRCH
jgi:hypothetical protein